MNSINFKQKVLLVIASVIFISSGVYPNWIEKVEWTSRDTTEIHNLGRHLILDPPYNRGSFDFPKHQFVNTTQLFIEWAVVVFPTAILFFVFKNPPNSTAGKKQ